MARFKRLCSVETAALAAGIMILAAMAACAVNPVTGRDEFVLMSESQELAMGKAYYPQTTQMSYGLPPDDPGLQQYVNQVGQKLARTSHRPNIPWEFNVVNTSQVNAFALPGGKVSLTRGLLLKMNSEDEMASVVGHEIGHITARHTVAQYTRGMLISAAALGLGVAMSGSEYQVAGMAAAGTAGSLLMLSYSREQERQADQLGYDYMVRNAYNPKGQVKVFETFMSLNKSQPGQVQALLMSHPLTSERVATARWRVENTDPKLTGRPFRVKEFKQAMAKQEKRRAAYEKMDQGDKLMGKKDYQGAAESYRQAIGLYGKDGVIHAKLAAAFVQQNKLGPARQPAKQGAEAGPKVFFTGYVAGVTFWKSRDYAQALSFFEQADGLIPSNARTKLYMADCQEKMGRGRSAAALYQRIIQLAPQSREARVARGRLYRMGY